MKQQKKHKHIIKAINIDKYFGHVHALKGINLELGNNEILGLIGDNGAGKSTLIKILTGVFPPTSGELYLRDQKIDFRHYNVKAAHKMGI